MQGPDVPPPPRDKQEARKEQRRGRLLVTAILIAGFVSGILALREGKRLAGERRARFAPAADSAAPPAPDSR